MCNQSQWKIKYPIICLSSILSHIGNDFFFLFNISLMFSFYFFLFSTWDGSFMVGVNLNHVNFVYSSVNMRLRNLNLHTPSLFDINVTKRTKIDPPKFSPLSITVTFRQLLIFSALLSARVCPTSTSRFPFRLRLRVLASSRFSSRT